MTEYYNNTLCIEAGWLVDSGIISKANYKYHKSVGNLTVLRRGCRATAALIEYDSINVPKVQQEIIKLIGDPRASTKHISFQDYLQQDVKAIDYFNRFAIPDGSPLPEKNKLEYAANAAVLNAIDELINNKLAKRKALGNAKTKVWEKLTEIVAALPFNQWPHKLPANSRRLKHKFAEYKKRGYEELIHSGFCNKNSEKINEDAKWWLIQRFADRINKIATIKQLWREYNSMAKDEGWKRLNDDRTIYTFLNQEEIKPLWYGHRYGELKAKEKYTYFHKTKLPSMRDSLWYGDGTKMNYYYLDAKGKMATCQVYEVIDAFSEVFLGYHISATEDYEAQYMAYKMAAKTAGHRPYQLGFDGQGGHNKLQSGQFLTKLARLSIKAQPYNGKSKTIENAFARLQQQFLKRDWFFTGQNIQTKSIESKANMEFILANVAKLPTLDEVKAIYATRRQEWNEAPHPKTGILRLEMYLNSVNPESPELSLFDMVDLFWILREKPSTYAPSGLSFTEKKIQYDYSIYDEDRSIDMDFHVKNIDKKFHIKFDPEDMSLIYLYEMTPLGLKFVTAAETKTEVARNRQEITEFEDKFIREMSQKNKIVRVDIRDETNRIQALYGTTNTQQGFNEPPLKGIESSRRQKNKLNPKVKIEQKDIAVYQKELSNVVAGDDDDDDMYNRM